MPARVVVLASGSGSTLQALLDARGDAFTVVAVGSDKPGAAALERARTAGAATFTVPPAEHPDRAAWDEALAAAVAAHHPDLVVLAGFMRIVGAPLLDAFGGRLVNTHPALLPSFPGAHGVRDALAHGVKVTGCTVHLVDAGVDTGPILDQAAVRVLDDDDEASLHERIKDAERHLLVDVVARLARGELPTTRPS
ncbi:phosphoribosylglycinamide formyltransferase [Kineococcus sp. G2]|uniref:phosphoribosylglycinamide formyltransferase n=1 Tax=Kineococcus sp. G2 TaxID=3127484 RepID=UPI00301D6273